MEMSLNGPVCVRAWRGQTAECVQRLVKFSWNLSLYTRREHPILSWPIFRFTQM